MEQIEKTKEMILNFSRKKETVRILLEQIILLSKLQGIKEAKDILKIES